MDDPKSEKVALFRYGLIATLVLEQLSRGELMRRARELAALHYDIPFSERTTISVGTLLKWARRYRKGGLDALNPKRRKDRGVNRVISPQLAQLIERLKRENPHRTGTTLLRELALSSNDPNSQPLSAATLYRFLKEHGLTQKQLLSPPAHKKFEAEFANQIWQSDMMFGPYIPRPGGGKQQAMLYALLDDASRLVPHAQFYADEGLESLLDCTRQGIAARGIPVRFYVDNGKVYRSAQLARIAATLGILIVHTPPYQPEGRGKIERFFRSVRDQFLASLDLKQVTSMKDLNTRLDAWIQTAYHLPPIWPVRKWRSASIRSIHPRPMFSRAASSRAPPGWPIRSPMVFGSPPNPNRRPLRHPPASTTSNFFTRNGRMAMFETFFGFKKSPFASTPDSKQLFESGAWTQLKARLQFLTDHRGAGLLTGEPGSGKSTAARTWLAGLNPNLYKIVYLHWSSGSALDLLRQLARDLDLEPSHFKGDLVDQIAEAIVRLNKTKKQHPIVVFDEAQLLSHPALEQIPLLLNFDMDSSTYLTLLLIGQPLLRRTLSLQHHEALRQRIAVHYHLEGLSRSELDDYIAHQLKAAGCTQPVFDDTARQALYQATKGIPRKVNKLALTALRLAASRKVSIVDEAVLMDAAAEALL